MLFLAKLSDASCVFGVGSLCSYQLSYQMNPVS